MTIKEFTKQVSPSWHLTAIQVSRAVAAGYSYDPGDSDLDNEQTIHVKMTLGDYRKALALLRENSA